MKEILIKSPESEREAITIPKEVAQIDLPFEGMLCSKSGFEVKIQKNIIDCLGDSLPKSTLAQMSNHWKVTASVYEDVWRVRALDILSGEEFPIDEEQRLLQRWMNPVSDALYLDVGCSTALYARALVEKQPEAAVVALDFSQEMLKEAKKKIPKGSNSIFLLRADASDMPFFANSFDGAVCGGSLNEFFDPAKVLHEVKRIVKQGGKVFMMHLLEASTWYGKGLQQAMKQGGLHFWTQSESNLLFEKSGFTVEKQQTRGIVCFTLLAA